jgi:urea-proton symporter
MLPITDKEAGDGLVPPAVAYHLLGDAGAVLILVMLFMAITSTGAAESMAVSSLVVYDIYREYINPKATGDQIIFVSRFVIVAYGIFSGTFAIILNSIGLNLGWVYLFMGVCIGSAVCPLWNLLTWSKASGTGAVFAAWGGFALGITGWLLAAKMQAGYISVDTLGTNEVMLAGNLIAILSSGLIHVLYSVCIDPQDYDFDQLDTKISLVEKDMRGLGEAEKNPVMLTQTQNWIVRRGFGLTLVLVVVWPLLSIPAGVFSKSYFAFWVLISIAWGFGAGITITFLPLSEYSDEIDELLARMCGFMFGRAQTPADGEDLTVPSIMTVQNCANT